MEVPGRSASVCVVHTTREAVLDEPVSASDLKCLPGALVDDLIAIRRLGVLFCMLAALQLLGCVVWWNVGEGLAWLALLVAPLGLGMGVVGGVFMLPPALQHLHTMQQLPFTAWGGEGGSTQLGMGTPLPLPAVTHIRAHLTNQLGNHVFQYIFARTLAEDLGASFASPPLGGPFTHLPTALPAPAEGPPRGGLARVTSLLASPLNVWVQDTGLYDSGRWERAVGWLRASADAAAAPLLPSLPTLGDTDIVLHVRLGDIVSGLHASYRPLPYLFYREAIARVMQHRGAPPARVLIVTNEPGHAISKGLASALGAWLAPTNPAVSVEVYSHSMVGDFALMMHAPNLVLSVSTFSWWAGVLGGGFLVMPLHGNAWPAGAPPSTSTHISRQGGRLDTPSLPGMVLQCFLGDCLGCGGVAWGTGAKHGAEAGGLDQEAVEAAQALPPAPLGTWSVVQEDAALPDPAPPTSRGDCVFRLDRSVPGARQCLLLPPSQDGRVAYIALHLARWGGEVDIPSLFVGAPAGSVDLP